MLDKGQWLEVGAMELVLEDGYESSQISAMEVDQLLPEARERIKEKAIVDENKRNLCKQVTTGGNVDGNFSVTNELLSWKNRI
jgi:hypothetical protein